MTRKQHATLRARVPGCIHTPKLTFRPEMIWEICSGNYLCISGARDQGHNGHKTVSHYVSTQQINTAIYLCHLKVRKRAEIRNRYNQAPHLTQDTTWKVTTSQLDITNESQEVSPFSACDHKASTNRRA